MDPTLLLAIVCGGALVVIVGGVLIAHLRQQGETGDAWDGMARRLGGTLERNSGDERRMRAMIVGHEVTAHQFWEGAGDTLRSHTHIDTICEAVGPFRLVIVPRRIPPTDADVLIGDPDFDRDFLVRTNDHALALSWLASRTRSALRDSPHYSYTVEGSQVHAEYYGSGSGADAFSGPSEPNVDEIGYAAEAAVALARGGEWLRERWAKLARTQAGQFSCNGLYVQLELPSSTPPVTISTEHAGETHVIVLRIRFEGARAEIFEICPADYRALPELDLVALPAGLLPPGMVAASSEPARTAPRIDETIGSALAQLLPVWARSDGQELVLGLAGAEPDQHRIQRAIGVAQGLLSTGGGAYRS